MNNYNDYYNFLNNGFNDMNYMTDYNSMMQDMNYNNAFNNTFLIPNNQNQIVDSYEGFIRGNMFNNLYDPYKNYQPQIKATSEREELLNKVRQLKFAMIDLNLYLDTNPNDKNAIMLFNNYRNQEKKACEEFERKYGPLTIDSEVLSNNTWIWNNGPWPWEVQK